jgi:hypothetical protein
VRTTEKKEEASVVSWEISLTESLDRTIKRKLRRKSLLERETRQ